MLPVAAFGRSRPPAARQHATPYFVGARRAGAPWLAFVPGRGQLTKTGYTRGFSVGGHRQRRGRTSKRASKARVVIEGAAGRGADRGVGVGSAVGIEGGASQRVEDRHGWSAGAQTKCRAVSRSSASGGVAIVNGGGGRGAEVGGAESAGSEQVCRCRVRSKVVMSAPTPRHHAPRPSCGAEIRRG